MSEEDKIIGTDHNPKEVVEDEVVDDRKWYEKVIDGAKETGRKAMDGGKKALTWVVNHPFDTLLLATAVSTGVGAAVNANAKRKAVDQRQQEIANEKEHNRIMREREERLREERLGNRYDPEPIDEYDNGSDTDTVTITIDQLRDLLNKEI